MDFKEIAKDASLNEKLDNLLLSLYDKQKYLGCPFNFKEFIISVNHFVYGATTKPELEFYLNLLVDRKFISKNQFEYVVFTESGINYCLSILESGLNSNKCFIAMSFSDEHKVIYDNGILPALNETNFEPIKVNEDKTLKYRSNESTINDFILFSIKQSKFCIADYTGNKNGVYFETGYALAKGKNVIYTCLESEFKNVHFDTNRFPFIRYKSAEELKETLINRINEIIF